MIDYSEEPSDDECSCSSSVEGVECSEGTTDRPHIEKQIEKSLSAWSLTIRHWPSAIRRWLKEEVLNHSTFKAHVSQYSCKQKTWKFV